jgi:heme oxygenase
MLVRQETSVMHAAVDAMVSILGPTVSIDDYRRFLGMLRGFHHPIEQRLQGGSRQPGVELALAMRAP